MEKHAGDFSHIVLILSRIKKFCKIFLQIFFQIWLPFSDLELTFFPYLAILVFVKKKSLFDKRKIESKC